MKKIIATLGILLILIIISFVVILKSPTCDFIGGWGRGKTQQCKCQGIKVTLDNSLSSDGNYSTVCVGRAIPYQSIQVNPIPLNTSPISPTVRAQKVMGEVASYFENTEGVVFQLTPKTPNISQVYITTDVRKTGKWEPFSEKVFIPHEELLPWPGYLYVKFRDINGNESEVVKDSVFPLNSPPRE